jgi:predicted molibdopterin-dependent oxidoreductase YjgC
VKRSTITVSVDGAEIPARVGETVAALLVRNGRRLSLFCGMGACHVCVVTLDGVEGRRACVEEVRSGMRIELEERA